MPIEDLKTQLRESIRANRRQRGEKRLAEVGEQIRDIALELEAVQTAKCVALYCARQYEPQTLPLIKALHERGIKILLPMLGDGLARGWGYFVSEDDLIVRAPGRPLEPANGFLTADALIEADIIFVPALAVDTNGSRLGQGGGWYDRALKSAKPNTPIYSLNFKGEVLDADTEALPQAEHDMPVHAAITPAGVRWLSS